MKSSSGAFFKSKRFMFSVFSIVLCVILLLCAQASVPFANWYTTYIYPLFVNTFGRFFGIFPFSVSELLIYVLIFLILFFLLRLVIRTIRKKSSRKDWAHFGLNLLCTAAALFLLYTLCCGINYGRTSFSETAEIVTSPYTVAELSSVCETMMEKVNELAGAVPRADDMTALMGGDLNWRARDTMNHLGTLYPELAGYYPNPKGFTVPAVLSVQNLSGIYLPFTVEANYNKAMIPYNIPFTACHELSHLRGFMQEEEANFIAWLACINSGDKQFEYSGYLMGWLYASNQLYDADYESYRLLADKLDSRARADLNANNAFWAKYEGQIAEVSNQINDNYLKANGQSDGVESYDRMVDLMVAYLSLNCGE